ncbi:MAG: NADP-dependent oxidoreductase [Novosphingobium sp.]
MKSWIMRRRTDTLHVDDYALVDIDAPAAPGPGEVRLRTLFISLDPYLSRFMKIWEGEHPGWQHGHVYGRTVAEVTESRAEGLAVGDKVLAVARWQPENVVPAASAMRIDPEIDPPSLVLGVLGASGRTAWFGLDLAHPKAGETLLVSAASGPVGSVVGQLAKRRGLRAIGIAGGAEKCAYVESLGFDVCLDHRLPDLAGRLAAAAPKGVDILFENIGQTSLDAALSVINEKGRIMLCGLAQHYNDEAPMQLEHFKALLYKQVMLQGFRTADFVDRYEEATAELMAGVREGWLRYDEQITDGLEHAAEAYLAMLGGQGIGKRLIRLP